MESGIRAVVFDMDGLMIDSEPLWHRAEIKVFGELGVVLNEAACLETTGLRVDEAVQHHFAKRPWSTGESVQSVTAKLIAEMVSLFESGPPEREGLRDCIAFFQQKQVPLAVASSSPKPLIEAAIKGLGMQDVFKVLCTAVDENFGKPHPQVYISAARALGVQPQDCLALEDSFNGVISAKAARMRCIAVPDREFEKDLSRFACANVVLGSLSEINDSLWTTLERQH